MRVHASGVNPLDSKIRAGAAPHARVAPPAILGLDMAGLVEAVGEGVTEFGVGDEVYGLIGGVGALPGSLAEYVAVDAASLAKKPRALSMREAAALPLIAITAWEGLVDRAHVHAGQRVLIQGGAGGVGHVAIQIARALGAEVFASARGEGELLAPRVEPDSGDFDVVYDTVGGAMLDASFLAVRRFGHVVSCLGWGSHALAPLSFKGGTYSGVFTLRPLLGDDRGERAHQADVLNRVAALVDAGQLRPRVDPRRFGLEGVNEAHRVLANGEARGKLVISLA